MMHRVVTRRLVRLIGVVALSAPLISLVGAAPSHAASGVPLIGLGGNCVDVANANATNGQDLWMWDCNGTPAQQFTVTSNGQIQVMGKCLDIEGPSLDRGADAQIWDCQNVPQHKWRVSSSGEIVSNYSGKCIDVAGASTTIRARVQLWDCNGSAAQKWYAYGPNYVVADTKPLYTHTYQLALTQQEVGLAMDIFMKQPTQFFPFRVSWKECSDCSKVMGLRNILYLEGSYRIGDVMVVDTHSRGWTFLALPGHIAQGGVVTFTLLHSSDTYDPNDRGAFLTVTAHGRGGVEALSPQAAEYVGRIMWSQMAAAINCWDHRRDNPNAGC